MLLKNELKKHIKVVSYPLKDGKELELALKAKLTKKELKLLKSWSNNEKVEKIIEKLNLTENSYKELSTKLIKKLNREKVKQVLYKDKD